MKRLVRAGDRAKCCGNTMYGLVVTATEQWVILVNDEPQYLEEHPEDTGVEFVVKMKDIVDIRPTTKLSCKRSRSTGAPCWAFR